jgi:hypothetical protein
MVLYAFLHLLCKLNLRGCILKSNNLDMDSRPNIKAIYSNMFSELMLDWISDNDSTGTVTMHRCRGGESNTKISQDPL